MLQARTWLPRTEGSVRLDLVRRGGRTDVEVLHQAGAARMRFPRTRDAAAAEAVLVNTAGGLTGGDKLDVSVSLAEGADAVLTTAAAEKIYRARDRDGAAAISVRLSVAAGGRLAWLPQATIVFDEARFERRTEVTLDADSSFLAAEALLFGRLAMGEDVHRGVCRDVWRVRRAGSLVFADTLLLEGAIADTLDHKATLDGARAAGFVLYVAPDAADRVENVRAALHGAGSVGGASAWNGLLVARAVARDGHTLLADLARLVELLSGRPLPRVCQC